MPTLNLGLTDAVCLFRINLDDSASRLDEYRQILSLDEQEKADRYRKHVDYCRSVISRAVLRQLLGRVLESTTTDIQFEYGAFGKPALASHHGSDVHFNVSHSGNWILIGLSAKNPIGVDVEEMRAIESLEGLAKSTFSAVEFEIWRDLPAEYSVAGFFRGWTCKEALIKAFGMGISLPLDNVQVGIDPRSPTSIVRLMIANESIDQWQVNSIPIASGYCAALACKSSIAKIEIHDWRST